MSLDHRRTTRRIAIVAAVALAAGLGSLAVDPSPASAQDTTTFTDGFDRANGAVGNGWRAARGTWAIASGAVAASGSTSERMLMQESVPLGKTFAVSATVSTTSTAPASRAWNGVAANVVDNGNGTQTFYVVRAAQALGNASRLDWQLLKVSDSQTATGLVYVTGGWSDITAGQPVRLGLESVSLGTGIVVRVEGAVTKDVYQYAPLPFGSLVSGGYAGLYAHGGANTFDDVTIVNSTVAAGAPLADPGPLSCTVAQPDGYTLPGLANTVAEVVPLGNSWSGHPVTQQILNHGDDQYAAYYDENRVMTVAHRTLDQTTWTIKQVDSTLGWDSHNYVTMALDPAGNLHLSGNMHNVPLVYFRTTTPGDVTTLTRVANMVDPAVEQRVTYPSFFTGPSGELMFSHRDGMSGDGVTLYNRYDETTQTWSALLTTPLLDGEGLRNAYPMAPKLGPDGFFHLVWTWRDTTDAGSTSRLSYMRSTDLVHWETSTGTPLTLPVTYDSPTVVDPVPIYGGIINSNINLGFDGAGKPVISYTKFDEQLRTQFNLAHTDAGGAWVSAPISEWTGRWHISGGGSLSGGVRVGAVSALADGMLRVDYKCVGGVGVNDGPSRSWIVDPATFQPVYDVPTPALPAAITTPQSTFPGIQVKTVDVTAENGDRYVLRWESMPANADQPRPPSQTPPAQPITVYRLVP
ncbi:BNR repeat-containing protein [Plantibacter sp. YIM 135249]|uniref:BNR repeat-containing protein n=1 Tax=Plantibacter sp. YIM 135249 TaxID=3423918 RepID=UPI003D343351